MNTITLKSTSGEYLTIAKKNIKKIVPLIEYCKIVLSIRGTDINVFVIESHEYIKKELNRLY